MTVTMIHDCAGVEGIVAAERDVITTLRVNAHWSVCEFSPARG